MSDKKFLKSLFSLFNVFDADKETVASNEKVLNKIENILHKAIDDDEPDNDYGEGFSVVNHPDEDTENDAADDFLNEQSSKEATPTKTKPKNIYRKAWDSSKYDKHADRLQPHKDAGFSDRESVHREGLEPSGAVSGTEYSEPSSAAMKVMKAYARRHNQTNEEMIQRDAKASTAPIKAAEGKVNAGFYGSLGDAMQSYQNFLNSPEMDKLSDQERHKAASKWMNANVYNDKDKVSNISDLNDHFDAADTERSLAQLDRTKHFQNFGNSGETSGMNARAAAEHVGGTVSDEGGIQTGQERDPAAAIANQNKKVLEDPAFKQKMEDRINRLTSKVSDRADRLKRINAQKAISKKGSSSGGEKP